MKQTNYSKTLFAPIRKIGYKGLEKSSKVEYFAFLTVGLFIRTFIKLLIFLLVPVAQLDRADAF